MSVLRQANILGQQRLDVPHLRAIESSIAADFDLLGGQIMAGLKPVVIRGFSLVTNGAVGNPATSLQLTVAGSIVMHPLGSEAGTIFSVPEDQAAETLDSTNSSVEGAFTANQVNYVGLDLTRTADDSTSDLVMFLDANTLLETPKTVPLARTLGYRIVISTTDFSNTENVLPLAKVTTNSLNTVTAIEDARSMMFRLGSGGGQPDKLHTFTWLSGRNEKTQDTAGSVFAGGDKSILSQKDWGDAIMTRLWEVAGGEYWYSPTTDRDVKLAYGQPVLGSTQDNFDFNSGTSLLQWDGLSILFANSTAQYNTITAGSATLLDGQCLYVDVNRAVNGSALAPAVANLSSLGTPTVPGSRFVIAWRRGTLVYARDRGFEVGRTASVASTTILGIVKLFQTAGAPTAPVVLNLDANNTIGWTAANNTTSPALALVGGTKATNGGSGSAGLTCVGGGSTGNGIAGIGASITGGTASGSAITGGTGLVVTGGGGNQPGVGLIVTAGSSTVNQSGGHGINVTAGNAGAGGGSGGFGGLFQGGQSFGNPGTFGGGDGISSSGGIAHTVSAPSGIAPAGGRGGGFFGGAGAGNSGSLGTGGPGGAGIETRGGIPQASTLPGTGGVGGFLQGGNGSTVGHAGDGALILGGSSSMSSGNGGNGAVISGGAASASGGTGNGGDGLHVTAGGAAGSGTGGKGLTVSATQNTSVLVNGGRDGLVIQSSGATYVSGTNANYDIILNQIQGGGVRINDSRAAENDSSGNVNGIAFKNQLVSSNIPKAWGRILCNNTNPNAVACFNINTISYSGPDIVVAFPTGGTLFNANMGIVMVTGQGGGAAATIFQVSNITTAGFHISAYNTAGTQITLNNSGIGLGFVVFGTQA